MAPTPVDYDGPDVNSGATDTADPNETASPSDDDEEEDQEQVAPDGPIQRIMKIPAVKAAGTVIEEVISLEKDIETDVKRLKNSKIKDGEEGGTNLAGQVGAALMGAMAIYGFADWRAFARRERATAAQNNDNDVNYDRVLDLPIRASELMRLFFASLDKMKEANFDTELYLSAAEELAKEIYESTVKGDNGGRRPSLMNTSLQDDLTVLVFDDEQTSKELVYSISYDGRLKQLRVCFRGSVTVRDFVVDSDTVMIQVPNPLHKQKTTVPQSKGFGVHRGFYHYLFETKRNRKSKYQTIVDHLIRLLPEFPDTRNIAVTGHSLGGALSALFAFRLATDKKGPDIPIICITFASPRCGNIQFARAFQELEIQERLQHLRVANHKDAVTHVPNRLACCTVCCQDYIYRHVGMELMLYREPGLRFHFPYVHRSRSRLFLDDAWHSFGMFAKMTFTIPLGLCHEDYLKWHSCKEYMVRLGNVRDKLEEISIFDVYNKYLGILSERRG